MARDHARVKLSIWLDDDFLDRTPPAQHLYFVLFSHPQLTNCGVTDWRPNRIAPLAKGWTSEAVAKAADELVQSRFIVTDDSTEEVLLRTWVRHDGILKSPNMAVAMIRAYAEVASRSLRAVILDELRRARAEEPGWSAWSHPTSSGPLSELIGEPVPDVSINPSEIPAGTLSATHPEGDASLPTPYSLLPTPNSKGGPDGKPPGKPRARKTGVPAVFVVTDAMRKWASQNRIKADLDAQTERFLDHATANAATHADWVAAWRNWMRKAEDFAPRRALASAPQAKGW